MSNSAPPPKKPQSPRSRKLESVAAPEPKKALGRPKKVTCYRCGNPVARGRLVCVDHVDAQDQQRADAAGMTLERWREHDAASRKQRAKESARLTAIETKAAAAERLLAALAEHGWEVPELGPTDVRSPYAVSPGAWHLGFARTGARSPFLRNIPATEEQHVFTDTLFLEIDTRGLTVEDLIALANGRVASFRESWVMRRAEEAEAQARTVAFNEERRLRNAPNEEQFQTNVHRNVGILAGTLFRDRERSRSGETAPTLAANEAAWRVVLQEYLCAPALCVGGMPRRLRSSAHVPKAVAVTTPPRAPVAPEPARIADTAPLPPARQPVRALPRVGRNEPCPCGSGKKFKKCCIDQNAEIPF